MAGKSRKLPDWMIQLNQSEDPSRNKTQRKTVGEVLDGALPELLFAGSLIYSYHINDCSLLCDDLLSSIPVGQSLTLGFDMEWPIMYQAGRESKTALLQLCPSSKVCYLFHLSCMGTSIPHAVRELLQDSRVKLVGIGIESDLWKLERDFDVSVISVIRQTMIDLSKLANAKLRTTEKWSLENLTKYLLKHRVNKDPAIRKSDWSQYPLSESQQQYAATDAFACIKLYEELIKR